MKKIMIIYLLINILSYGEVILKYGDTKNKEYLEIRKILEKDKILITSTNKINKYIDIEPKIEVIISGDEGVYYDIDTSTVQISYEYVGEVIDRYKNGSETLDEYGLLDENKGWKEHMVGAILHTYYHEIGHGIVDKLNIPILGKEEDAVDDLATIMLINLYEDGGEYVMSSSEAYLIEGQEVERYDVEEFASHHSLDEQRAFRSLGLLYGSNPRKYRKLAKKLEFDSETKEEYVNTYENKVENWNRLLEPYLK